MRIAITEGRASKYSVVVLFFSSLISTFDVTNRDAVDLRVGGSPETFLSLVDLSIRGMFVGISEGISFWGRICELL